MRQVAGFLQLHRRTVANWCISGRIKAVKLGDDWRITGAEVMRLAGGGENETRCPRVMVDLGGLGLLVLVLFASPGPLDRGRFDRYLRGETIANQVGKVGVRFRVGGLSS